ncbi:hypothetical protein ACOMHN_006437 [Nucella lapillus]
MSPTLSSVDAVSLSFLLHTLKRVEELGGRGPPPVDAYDKLVAWLAEMAESDNVHLDTSVFVKQLTSVYRDNCNRPAGANTPTSTTATAAAGGGGTSHGSLIVGGGGGGSSERGSLTMGPGSGLSSVAAGGLPRRGVALRQHSASCDSRASSSVDTQRLSVGRSSYSRSFDDTVDHRHAWRHHSAFTSRQGTCSDDLEEDPDVRNASMESLYSGSDRDSEVEAMASTYSWEPSASRRARFSQQRDMRRPLLRQALLGSSSCSSTGDYGDYGRASATASASGSTSFNEGTHTLQGSVSRYSGYGSCSNRSSMTTMSSAIMADGSPVVVPCSASTGDLHKITLALEEVSGQGQTPAKVMARRRSASLLSLTPPHPPPPPPPCYHSAAAAAAAAPLTASTQALPLPLPDATHPKKTPHPVPAMFLDDALLDGNLADILFSVEALWPKPKK